MNKDLSLRLYKKLYLIRKVEEKIIELYSENEMKCPMHMSMGQEAVSVGVISALDEKDQVCASYRSHAPFLAKTGDIDTLFGELFGRITGSARGKGGSMHVSAIEKGYMGSSGIVGSNIPLALGAAFANKYKGNHQVACVFFGDGAIDEGVFWESLNLACVKKLPVLFVVEDNGFAVDTSVHERQGFESITDIVGRFECCTARESTSDVEIIYDSACRMRVNILLTNKPGLIHFKCCRYLEHVGIQEDTLHKSMVDKWKDKDCVTLQKKRLLRHGFKKLGVQALELEIESKINDSIREAKNQFYPDFDELYDGVFYGGK